MKLPEIVDLIAQGALFVINHSGGKDSQAMTTFLRATIPASQLVVVHAHLPGVEWDGVREHILDTTQGLPYYEVRANKTFLGMVKSRKKWPSAKYRQCTSDLKRDPIDKQIRSLAKDRGCSIVVSCLGLRSEESTARAKQPGLKINARQSKAGRAWYVWNPILEWSIFEVWKAIADAGQKRHWAYDAGMSRLSCCFCIMASKSDQQTAAKLRPELLKEIVALEKETGHTFISPKKGREPVTLDIYLAA